MEAATEGAPDPPPKRLRLTPRRLDGNDIIVLAPFDGVGAPHHIIQQLFGTPRLSVSWEIDRACRKVMNARTSWVVQRGQGGRPVREGPHQQGGPGQQRHDRMDSRPPCQDFSRITEGPGHQGERGGLFLTTVTLMQDVKRLTFVRRFGFLYENVVMQPSMADKVSEALDAQPVLVLASVDWSSNLNDPKDDGPLQWTKQGK